jgi:hypothetical protein
VVLGETRTYSFEAITKAIRLINDGARFIATNPDVTGPSNEGALPACGSVAALISKATGVEPYFIGKPNPMMMRSALNAISAHSESAAMIGDRMDTDVLCGLEAGLETILVLSGISTRGEVERYPYRPSRIIESVAELIDEGLTFLRVDLAVVCPTNQVEARANPGTTTARSRAGGGQIIGALHAPPGRACRPASGVAGRRRAVGPRSR